ncbi:MAG TPA: membrane protein insertase YidC, partial [Thermoanaerobaculia bacterium]|nr:membrane protein insertase YidC [Thermoanaerobaculia bacterium]
METKRLILAFSLSAAVMILWTILFPSKPDQAAPPKPPATTGAATPAAPAPTAAPTAVAAPTPGVPPVPVPPLAATAEETLTVDRPLYTAVVANRGGALRSFVLKKYLDAKGKPLDLVRHGSPYPGVTLTLDTTDPFLARAAEALFVVERSEAEGATTIRFRYREADGNGIVRSWVFRSEYQVAAKVVREGGPGLPVALVLGPGIGNPSAEELANQYTKPGTAFALSAGGSVTRKPRGDLKEALALGPGLVAAGIEDIYFVTAFLPGTGASATLRPVALAAGPAATGTPAAGEVENVAVLSAAGTLETDLFLGPKEIAVLEKVRPGLDKLIDYGWFALLVKPLLWTLKAIQSVVKNWGVAIVLITV